MVRLKKRLFRIDQCKNRQGGLECDVHSGCADRQQEIDELSRIFLRLCAQRKNSRNKTELTQYL